MKKTTVVIILGIIAVICIVLTAFACSAMSPLWAAMGGFATAAFACFAFILPIAYDTIFPFVKYDEEIENEKEVENHIGFKGTQTFHEMHKFNDNDVYIMYNNVVRHRSTGEDLYHGLNFDDCKAWCECHDYTIINDF